MKRIGLFIACAWVLSVAAGIAQTTYNKHTVTVTKSATMVLREIKEDWNPVIQNVEMPHPGINDPGFKFHHIKDSLRDWYSTHPVPRNASKVQTPLAPYLGLNFATNSYNNSTPCDNDVAISNGGKLISVMNSTVFVKDVISGQTISYVGLDAFFTALGNTEGKFDPKTLYDPGSDRFVVLCLAGYTDSTSSILVGFSQSNDPGGAWNVYEIPGNPLNNSLWTDYPMISVSNQELFITINLLYNNMPWQTGFNETLIWQVNKNSGYNGAPNLTLGFYNNIKYAGRHIRNLCPAKGGSAPYGPNQYFVSNRNLDAQNDTIFLVELTDTLNSPNAMINATALVSGTPYVLPPMARQKNNAFFETNDQRILGAFFENNKVQFVQNTISPVTGFAAIYHGTISNVTGSPTVNGAVFDDDSLDIGYPNISYAGNGASDNTSIISFDHSSPQVFAGMSAVVCDGNGGYSPMTRIKDGLNYVIVVNGPNQRWGDYSGSQRKYNEPGVVWVSGEYGTSTKKNAAWAAQLSLAPLVSVKNVQPEAEGISFYPNPVTDVLNVHFTLANQQVLRFEVYDLQGRKVHTMLNTRVKKGENMFSFSTQPLAPGTYSLVISSAEGTVLSRKFVKQ